MKTFSGVCAVVAALAALSFTQPAQAAWPEKPVKLVLPFGPGGVADVTSRIMAEKLSQKFGQNIVIENMPARAASTPRAR